ncbi:tumor necrosis factor receptor superfamily member 6B [Erinaceus europaeus]|uniref:Tumor necrosis factor receptor superfamily member 6B n=1 Tax=Erinaceus europaeus TaxID=9365 RepID=A0A1S3WDK6_ERIEU|nr:tumor necrosis factor receptor superfamily member 6B [Erinaceus europaeus]
MFTPLRPVGTPVWLPVLLLALAADRAVAAAAPTFPWRDARTGEGLVCAQCPPGSFMRRPCGPGSATVCEPCPARHYTEFWNYLERCLYCNVICGEHEEEALPCTATHNRVCRCRAGFFEFAGFCLEHAPCPPGSGVAAAGTPSQNTQCQPCSPGTFSANSSSTESCQPHRNCSALGLVLNVPGSSFHDTLCTNCTAFLLGDWEPGMPGVEECESAILDFVAFQDMSFKRFLRLQQALAGQDVQSPVPPREGLAALQLMLRGQLARIHEQEGGGPLLERLLQALHTARLPALERSVRARFLPTR